MALGKAEGSGLVSGSLFRKHKHQGLGQTSQTRGIGMNKVLESSCLLTQLHVCIMRVMCDGVGKGALSRGLSVIIRKLQGGEAGSCLPLISQTGAFLVLSDHHMSSPVTGKEAAPLPASPTRKLFIHIKW